MLRGLALADKDTGAVVAAVHTGGRHDEVADAGQTRKGVDVAAHRHAQTGDLGDAPGDEGGAGVIAVAEAGGDADAQRDDVLHGTAQLHALDVVIGVDAHDVVGKDLLHEGRSLGVLAGRHDGGGQVDGHLLCVGGAGQSHKADIPRAALPAQLIGKDLRHGVQRVRLDALCHVHDDLAVGHIGPGLCCRGADEDRRHREQQDVLVLADLLDAFGEPQLLRDLHLRQVGVDAGRRKVIDLLLDGRPDQHIVPAHRQHPCKGHAPSSSAQNTNTFHHVCPPYPPRSRLPGRAACSARATAQVYSILLYPKAPAASTVPPLCTKFMHLFHSFHPYHAIFRNHLRSPGNHAIVFW